MALWPAPAEAAVTCTLNGSTVSVTLTENRDRAGIARTETGAIVVDGIPCGTATVTNTDLISVRALEAGRASVSISMARGGFVPGLTAEPSGFSEIEFDLDLGTGAGDDDLTIIGSPLDDEITAGGPQAAIALNADDDADVVHANVDNVVLNGGDGADVLSGAGGRGTGAPAGKRLQLNGAGGGDVLTGGLENDVFRGAGGVDTVSYAGRTTPVSVTLDTVANDGEAGESDKVETDVENVTGGSGADVLRGGAGTNALEGGPGADQVFGGDGNDLLVEGTVSSGADSLSGGAGTDAADYSGRTAGVVVTLDRVANDGEAGEGDNLDETVESVRGGSGPDMITGDSQVNALSGNAGDDTLTGLGAADELQGGEGRDRVDYSASPAGIVLDLAGLPGSGGDAAGDVATAVEDLTGSAVGDTVAGSPDANAIAGGGGDDSLSGRGGDDTLSGDDGDDLLVEEVIESGADTLSGGAGVDTADYSLRINRVRLSLDGVANDGAPNENDSLDDTIENLTGGGDGDTLTGNSADNRLMGGGGNDRLAGEGGGDALSGGRGTDTADYSDSAERVTVNLSRSSASGGDATRDALASIEGVVGSDEGDTLTGSKRADRLAGGDGHDSLKGLDGADRLKGDAGNDTISGGDGKDRIDGGEGRDTCVAGKAGGNPRNCER